MTNHEGHTPRRRTVFGKRSKDIIIVAVLVAVVVVGFLAAYWWLAARPQLDRSKLQVVGLSNGQVYFGYLQNTEGTYLVIKSPYTEQSLGASDKNEDGTAKTSQTALLRVKNQVYGPEDSIAIRSDQVSFWQNLRDDSKVTQAIKAKQDQ